MNQWIIGLLLTCTSMVVGAVAWLSVLVFKIGQKYGAVETQLATIHKAGERFEKANEKLDRIPLLETKLDLLADSVAEERRRHASEFPEMRDKVTALWEKVFSLQNWRKSRPQFDGE